MIYSKGQHPQFRETLWNVKDTQPACKLSSACYVSEAACMAGVTHKLHKMFTHNHQGGSGGEQNIDLQSKTESYMSIEFDSLTSLLRNSPSQILKT